MAVPRPPAMTTPPSVGSTAVSRSASLIASCPITLSKGNGRPKAADFWPGTACADSVVVAVVVVARAAARVRGPRGVNATAGSAAAARHTDASRRRALAGAMTVGVGRCGAVVERFWGRPL